MNKPHKHAEVIKAWADGAEIEAFDTFTGKWYSVSPTWSIEVQYRVSPELQWYDNIPEQGILCFVSDKSEAAGVSSRNVKVILSTQTRIHNGARGYAANEGGWWKYARPVTLEEIQHLIYKEN